MVDHLELSSGPLLSQQDILSLPRPSNPVVNPSGTLAIWPSKNYDFKLSKTTLSFYLIDLKEEGRSLLLLLKRKGLDNLEICWLDDQTIVYTTPTKPPTTDNTNTSHEEEEEELNDEEYKNLKTEWNKQNLGGIQGTLVFALNVETREEYCLGKFPVPISNLKSIQVPSSSEEEEPSALLGFSSSVFTKESSTIFTYPLEYSQFLVEQQNGSDIKVYDKTFVRHWDQWLPTNGEKTQVFIVRLSRNPKQFQEENESEEEEEEEEGFEKIDQREGKWSFEREYFEINTCSQVDGIMRKRKEHRPKVIAPMKGTKLECPVGPFGSSSDFSLSRDSLLIHSKDPNVSPSWHTRTNVYQFPLFPRSKLDQSPKLLSLGNQGASSNPRFSCRKGFKCAWLEMRQDGYEADRNRIMLFDFKTGERKGLTEEWDLSPNSLEWNLDGNSLLITCEEKGHLVLYKIPINGGEKERLTDKDSVTSFVALPCSSSIQQNDDDQEDEEEDLRILLTMNSFETPNELHLISSRDRSHQLYSSLTRSLLKGKKLSKGEEFYFSGAQGQEVHGWILFPPTSSSSSSSKDDKSLLPVANLCHGGPQSSWTSSWSTRWNPQSYTSQGYVTILINRTGSTGFGSKFCDQIQNDWGGKPFQDIVCGIEFVLKNWKDKLDRNRMASLGASYGGYMQNWIQGHNDSLGFKCLVCHDGVFNLSQTWYSTEELYFPTREFGGTPWEVPENYEKWNPANFIKNWKTPQLVIHGSKDYRLVESEGLGVFNTLQRLGIPSRLLIFPSENHWVLNPRNSLKWHEEVFRFIGEFTGTKEYVI
ncbi:hypothetical protein JCM3765_003916 [Sporobolomyces pararoseus]